MIALTISGSAMIDLSLIPLSMWERDYDMLVIESEGAQLVVGELAFWNGDGMARSVQK